MNLRLVFHRWIYWDLGLSASTFGSRSPDFWAPLLWKGKKRNLRSECELDLASWSLPRITLSSRFQAFLADSLPLPALHKKTWFDDFPGKHLCGQKGDPYQLAWLLIVSIELQMWIHSNRTRIVHFHRKFHDQEPSGQQHRRFLCRRIWKHTLFRVHDIKISLRSNDI